MYVYTYVCIYIYTHMQLPRFCVKLCYFFLSRGVLSLRLALAVKQTHICIYIYIYVLCKLSII